MGCWTRCSQQSPAVCYREGGIPYFIQGKNSQKHKSKPLEADRTNKSKESMQNQGFLAESWDKCRTRGSKPTSSHRIVWAKPNWATATSPTNVKIRSFEPMLNLGIHHKLQTWEQATCTKNTILQNQWNKLKGPNQSRTNMAHQYQAPGRHRHKQENKGKEKSPGRGGGVKMLAPDISSYSSTFQDFSSWKILHTTRRPKCIWKILIGYLGYIFGVDIE